MTAVLETSQDVRAALENLQKAFEQLRGEYVHGIKSEADYSRATLLLDELTDGHELNKYEEQMLIELEDAILAYERDSEQFKDFNALFKARTSPVQLIKHLMETLGLTGSDLPEIGDKTVVSKVLNGDRPISHKMAYSLAERFHMDPKAFIARVSMGSNKNGTATSRNALFNRKKGIAEVRLSAAGAVKIFAKSGPLETVGEQQVAASSGNRKPANRPALKR